jgi:hypothetical protein
LPTLLRIDGYRFYFYSHEPNEPPHVHIDHSGRSAKVWLQDIALAKNIGYSARELKRILGMVEDHRDQFLEAWHAYFGD